VFGRFETDYPNEFWVGDGLHAPGFNRWQTYVFAFLDDHTRLVTSGRYADVGLVSTAPALSGPVALSDLRAPRDPADALGTVSGAGAGEDRTVLQYRGFSILHRDHQRSPCHRCRRCPSRQHRTTLDELKALFSAWVEMVSHPAVQSTRGQGPLASWGTGWATRRPVRNSREEIAEAFRRSTIRTVTKSATAPLQLTIYRVDELLVGKRVGLVHDPCDIAGLISVTTGNGVSQGVAVLTDIVGTFLRRPFPRRRTTPRPARRRPRREATTSA